MISAKQATTIYRTILYIHIIVILAVILATTLPNKIANGTASSNNPITATEIKAADALANIDPMPLDVIVVYNYLLQVQPRNETFVSAKIAQAIVKEANSRGLAIDLVIGVIMVESEAIVTAVSPKGASGLMQIHGIWSGAKLENFEVNWKRIFQINYNIRCGTAILKQYRELTNNWDETLIKYSGGDKAYPDRVYKATVSYTLFRNKYITTALQGG